MVVLSDGASAASSRDSGEVPFNSISESPTQLLFGLITNSAENLRSGPDGMDKCRRFSNPGRGNINVTTLPTLNIGRDYLIQAVSKLGFPTVPLLGETVVTDPRIDC